VCGLIALRAADLGVSIADVGRTLETLFGFKRVTTYVDQGEEYDVILEGDYEGKRTPGDLSNVYVRSDGSGQLIPLSNLVTLEEFADSGVSESLQSDAVDHAGCWVWRQATRCRRR
jgi:multidrug efflux pump